MVMALAGNKADLLEARKVAAEASLQISLWFTSVLEFLIFVHIYVCGRYAFLSNCKWKR